MDKKKISTVKLRASSKENLEDKISTKPKKIKRMCVLM